MPTNGSAEETRQIIEGRLTEMVKESHNVQIELEIREEDAEFIMLRDFNGVFLEIKPRMKEPGSEGE